MPNWVPIAKTADCPPGTAVEVIAGDRVIALANVGGEFFALDGVCPHQGGPLGEGSLSGEVLTCPWHGWQFQVRTGQHCLSQTIRQRQFPVRVEGDQVLVDVDEPT